MRRALLLTGFWVLGVTGSVALAFAAVGSVASRVAPAGVARLSAGAVARELGSSGPSIPTRPRTTASAGPPSTDRGSTSTRPSSPGSTGTVPTLPPVAPVGSAPRPGPPSSAAPAPTTPAHDTVTTSQGGTLWTRCSSADQIVYVAAVPKSGYQRTRDVEGGGGVMQWFDNGSRLSKITAECSNGSVHAEVEEENAGGD